MNKKARGSAIVIAMLLISAVGGIAFSFVKIAFLELANASLYENGSVAYYAAESGIEEGFLRYRYNRNAEVPIANWELNDNKTYRSNINEMRTVIGVSSVGRPITNDLRTNGGALTWSNYNKQQIFDLRMGYIGTDGKPIYGQETDGNSFFNESDVKNLSYGFGSYQILKIRKDDSFKIDLTGLDFSGNELILHLKYDDSNSSSSFNVLNKRCKALAEIKFLVKTTASSQVREYKELLAPTPSACGSELGIDQNSLYGADAMAVVNGNNKQLYIGKNDLKDIFNQSGAAIPSASSVDISLYIKPLYYDAFVGISTSTCSHYGAPDCNNISSGAMPGPYSKIESTGYFGGVAKRLTANIDRQSGTLYDLYDYVIYKEN